MDETRRPNGQSGPDVVDLRGGSAEDRPPEEVEPEAPALTTAQLVRGVARAIGALKYQDEAARRAFEAHYEALVGMVLQDWLAFDECLPYLAVPQKLPPQVRLVVGVLVLIAGAAFIGPDGLRLPKRRAGEPAP